MWAAGKVIGSESGTPTRYHSHPPRGGRLILLREKIRKRGRRRRPRGDQRSWSCINENTLHTLLVL